MSKNFNYIFFTDPISFVEDESNQRNNSTLYRYDHNYLKNNKKCSFNKLFNPLFNDIQKIDICIINEIWKNVDESSFFVKDGFSIKKYYQKNLIELSNLDIFYLEIIVSYISCPQYSNFLIPFTKSNLEESNPVDIYNLCSALTSISIKNIYFVSDSLEWISIYTQEPIQLTNIKSEIIWKNTPIEKQDFFWVEGELDKITFELFIPNSRFLVGGSCSKIFSILNKNPDHKAIIDRDGYSSKTMAFFREKYDIHCTSTVECENLWLKPDIYSRISKINSSNFNFENFKKNVINRAEENFDNIFNRLENRQKFLEYHFIPYLDNNELTKLRAKFKSNIINNEYENILDWFDNKSLFELYIKEFGYRNLIDFKKEMIKHKHIFKDINLNTLIK